MGSAQAGEKEKAARGREKRGKKRDLGWAFEGALASKGLGIRKYFFIFVFKRGLDEWLLANFCKHVSCIKTYYNYYNMNASNINITYGKLNLEINFLIK